MTEMSGQRWLAWRLWRSTPKDLRTDLLTKQRREAFVRCDDVLVVRPQRPLLRVDPMQHRRLVQMNASVYNNFQSTQRRHGLGQHLKPRAS